MKRAVIIVDNGFEDTEFAYPFYRLQEAEFTVDVATKGKVDVKGKHGVAANATVDADEIKETDYDLAGGLRIQQPRSGTPTTTILNLVVDESAHLRYNQTSRLNTQVLIATY